jgi:hypothetical protein
LVLVVLVVEMILFLHPHRVPILYSKCPAEVPWLRRMAVDMEVHSQLPVVMAVAAVEPVVKTQNLRAELEFLGKASKVVEEITLMTVVEVVEQAHEVMIVIMLVMLLVVLAFSTVLVALTHIMAVAVWDMEGALEEQVVVVLLGLRLHRVE